MISQSKRDLGSFRDPESWIFNSGDQIIRRIPDSLAELLARPEVASYLQCEISAGRLVAALRIPEAAAFDLGVDVSARGQFLTHPRLPFVSYPYEWSGSMLADAARLTIDLQCGLLPLGLELKDATAFNVLFSRGAPIFVDWGSFRNQFRLDSWYALGQFHRMFLYPILLRATCGWTPAQSFSLNLDGVGLNTVIKEFSKIRLATSPTLWLDVLLPWLFEKYHNRNNKRIGLVKSTSKVDPNFLIANLRRLSRLIGRIEYRFSTSSNWSDYAIDCHYESSAEFAKEKVVEKLLRHAAPASVVDLGCNSGKYSRIAAGTGARVIAADGDEVAISRLHLSLRNRPADICPVVINFSNPSPALGWCNLERKAFIQRGSSDCAMALALVHHLRVACNWPISHIVEFLSQLGRKHIIVEFVPREDPMFQRITCLRDESYEDWNLDAWHLALSARFNLLTELKLPASSRTVGLWARH
jgi:hypothetical protein